MLTVIAETLRDRREQFGLSKYRVARRVGVSDSTISRIESATQAPSLETLVKLCDVLELSLCLTPK